MDVAALKTHQRVRTELINIMEYTETPEKSSSLGGIRTHISLLAGIGAN